MAISGAPLVYWDATSSAGAVVSPDCPSPANQLRPWVISAEPETRLTRAEVVHVPLDGDLAGCVSARGTFSIVAKSIMALLDNMTQAQTIGQMLPEWARVLGEDRAEHALSLCREAGLLCTLDRDDIVSTASTANVLNAWIHVTDKCNLRCKYCYLSHVPETMSRSTAKASVERIFRTAVDYGYRSIALKLAGGEPLLAPELVSEIHSHAQEQALTTGIPFSSRILSNGTITARPVWESIAANGVGATISLDGIGQSHDLSRPTVGNGSSFASVMRSLSIARQIGVDIQVSVTVCDENVPGLPLLARWLLAEKLPFCISFARRIVRASERGAFHEFVERLVLAMDEVFSAVEYDLPAYSLLGCLLDKVNLAFPHSRSCSAGEDYLAIDHRGGIASCQMLLSSPESSTATADSLAVLRQSGRSIYPSVHERHGCKNCEWKLWCAGGCPVVNKLHGLEDLASSPFCSIYKQFLPKVMRLEAMRLLRKYKLVVHA